MTYPLEPMNTVKEREASQKEELGAFDDWKERYAFILDLGDDLEEMPEILKVDANKIKGCVSQVWLFFQLKDGKMSFMADSDSLFVKGLVAVMVKIYSGLTPEEIIASKSNFLMDSGLVQNLSPNRANGAAAMQARIHQYAHEKRQA